MSRPLRATATSLLTTVVAIVSLVEEASAGRRQSTPRQSSTVGPTRQITLFLDCQSCYDDYLRSEVTFVDYVRDRTEADVHALITRAETGAGGSEYTLQFMGARAFDGITYTTRTVTLSSDTDDVIRRQIATALRVGILHYLSRETLPSGLAVTVRTGTEADRPAVTGDPWNNWVFSLRGSASFDGEETSRERELGADFSADRITPDWKVTFGVEIEHSVEEFDLDEEEPVHAERRERDFQWLVVNGLGEHWSIGATGDVESSTFDNIKLSISAAPAIEFNVFPYSAYTRRQLRLMYGVGVESNVYYETTLFGEDEETLPRHEVSLAYEQREPWGSLQGRTEWSQYLHDLSKTRLELEGEFSLRVARGLSVSTDVSASRIRDQLALPARGATDEEILLRIRRLQTGYEYSVGVSVTYTFGSIFSSVVNPRFGQ
ncbi:MAG TPA: hypothetical protein VFT47_09820 [Vicinamibacterales bacterium]|nr:hypothetical protein [Vicinamibacterales bacterium]